MTLSIWPKKLLDRIRSSQAKGFYPYEYMSDFERFKEELPSKENVYSQLTDKKVSDKKYEHILKVWNKFRKKKMKDYHDFHLKCDVLLFTDEIKA